MDIEHIAVASNSEEDSDKFFVDLLGLKKSRSFIVSTDKMEQFFGVSKEQDVIRYENANISVEVFITDDDSKVGDIFTHSCLLVDNRDELVRKAREMEFQVIQVPRTDSDSYYLFIRDNFNNLYEIKEI
jgi:catechol 2,3-dioxygenase-like lactoylglutathione lyase family enzyme